MLTLLKFLPISWNDTDMKSLFISYCYSLLERKLITSPGLVFIEVPVHHLTYSVRLDVWEIFSQSSVHTVWIYIFSVLFPTVFTMPLTELEHVYPKWMTLCSTFITSWITNSSHHNLSPRLIKELLILSPQFQALIFMTFLPQWHQCNHPGI